MKPMLDEHKCSCCEEQQICIKIKNGDWLCAKCWAAVRARLNAIRDAAETLSELLKE